MYIRTCKKGHIVDSSTSQCRIRNGYETYVCWECAKAAKAITNPLRYLPKQDLIIQFWNNVNKDGPLHPTLNSNCWLWLGPIDISIGYGLFQVYKEQVYAHRFSLSLTEILKNNHDVHHKCEIKRCIRQDHLEQLTHSQHVKLHWR